MQELEHGERQKLYEKEVELLKAAGDVDQGVKVRVDENYKNSTVILDVGGNKLVLSIRQARDLALEIRLASNRLERHEMENGVYHGPANRNGRKRSRRR